MSIKVKDSKKFRCREDDNYRLYFESRYYAQKYVDERLLPLMDERFEKCYIERVGDEFVIYKGRMV